MRSVCNSDVAEPKLACMYACNKKIAVLKFGQKNCLFTYSHSICKDASLDLFEMQLSFPATLMLCVFV